MFGFFILLFCLTFIDEVKGLSLLHEHVEFEYWLGCLIRLQQVLIKLQYNTGIYINATTII